MIFIRLMNNLTFFPLLFPNRRRYHEGLSVLAADRLSGIAPGEQYRRQATADGDPMPAKIEAIEPVELAGNLAHTGFRRCQPAFEAAFPVIGKVDKCGGCSYVNHFHLVLDIAEAMLKGMDHRFGDALLLCPILFRRFSVSFLPELIITGFD